ncbi:MAG TPA: enoyl-ACP reductase FabV [Rectinemataceae bacterium]|nr:enoyl-ACP reductase FabV [Rectinemataceae bacterium]
MIVKPMVRNNICINAHPGGCALETRRQIETILSRRPAYARLEGPKSVLVIGCSTGYGLASRIGSAFGFGAVTMGVSYERGPSDSSTGTPGWYNNRTFDLEAAAAGLQSKSFDGDAFSAAMKEQVIAAARAMGLQFDLVIYSLASPARTDPATGTVYRSVIKPIGTVYRGKTVDPFSSVISHAEVQPASPEEIEQTVKVMGGEDWELWVRALQGAGLLAPSALTLAYSYVGPELSWPIYRDGTIGRAKAHLEATALRLRNEGRVRAYVSINKALVTRASAVIPVIPLYVSILYKVMKERGIHEDCIDQIDRLYRERLYSGYDIALDADGRIRIDELEMGAAVQAEVGSRMARVDESTLAELADVEGFRLDFLRAHGFAVDGVDYAADVSPYGDTAPGGAPARPSGAGTRA